MKVFSLTDLIIGINEDIRMRKEITSILTLLKRLLPATSEMLPLEEEGVKIKTSYGEWYLMFAGGSSTTDLGLKAITFKKYSDEKLILIDDASGIPIENIAEVYHDLKGLIDGVLRIAPHLKSRIEFFINFAAVKKSANC